MVLLGRGLERRSGGALLCSWRLGVIVSGHLRRGGSVVSGGGRMACRCHPSVATYVKAARAGAEEACD